MRIDDCISCGNCVDFITNKECPADAISLEGNQYKSAAIDQDKCIGCGKCFFDIECLGESIILEEKEL